jgi:hypothetical protein
MAVELPSGAKSARVLSPNLRISGNGRSGHVSNWRTFMKSNALGRLWRTTDAHAGRVARGCAMLLSTWKNKTPRVAGL